MQEITLNLEISAEQYKLLYQGAAQTVYARSLEGKSVQFPASILRPFLLKTGVRGVFRIFFDHAGKFQGIEKLRDL